ncbi:class I adenylate-forming enzyme family protein [Streptomyces sp. NPDC058045]|uniref:class I adenylate-forming enzyme family protein n=1 Tax=Streptomyces sp. NPDC058045 TaxID=3346311 RepID=UPI0036E8741A
MWLTQLLQRNQQCFPDRTALVDERRSITWSELHDRTARLAVGLAGLGVQHGDRVAVLSLDRIEVLESYFALARLGAVFVPVNHSLTADEVTAVVERTGASTVLGEADLLQRHPDLPVKLRIAFDSEEFEGLADTPGTAEFAPVADHAVAAILHTSATTGQAKGVTVDHASFRAIALGWLAVAAPTDDMVLVNCCPLYHGSMVVSLTYLAAGTTVVLMPGFKPQKALALIEEHGATHVWLVPQMLRFMLQAKTLESADLSSLREVLYGAAPMPMEVYAEAAERLGVGFRQVYGMTEVGGPFVTLGPAEHPDPQGELPEILPAGRVIPGMSVRVLDTDDTELGPNAVGEVVVRGPGIMHGYWNDAAATAEVTVDGWIRTGDLGYLDDAGWIHLVDRRKDLIIRAGQNVYPAEIERSLRTHPAVLDVAVVGVPDSDYGEVPIAYAVVAEGTQPSELMSHVARQLAPYKRPRRIELIDQVPRNPAGKILKKLLRA